MFHCDPKTYVLSLLLASHIALVISAAPVGDYTNRLADGSSTAKTVTIPSSTSGNSDISSLLKEVAKLASGTTVININVGDKNLGSLLSDATSGATNPSGRAPESGVATGGFGDMASGGNDVSPLDGTGGADSFEDDIILPGVPAAVGDGPPGPTSNPGFGTADDDDDDDGDTDTTNSDSLVDSATQDDTESWKLEPTTSSDSPYPRSGTTNGTVRATTDSNSTAGIGVSSSPSNGTSHAAGGAPSNGASILKISIENTQKITVEKGMVTS
ncbi:hypothetical protein ARMSODRAFT_1083955 [Armillaria solidipes]|uniref:Uncharacterized protein n=1 Tax=Armillaria solidipes TaxID=1076256 RepID=A0A2H3C2F6_9AGAR|nr:hypothetical protein ARMSODRAFT_1083955 [Armillaria solidipes]